MCTCANDNCSGCGSFKVPIGPPGPQGPAGVNGTNGTNGPNWMSWTFEDGSDAYSTLTGGNGVYKTLAAIIYPGRNTITPPANVKVSSWDTGITGNNYDLELFDITNGVTLAVVLNANSVIPGSIQSLAVVSQVSWPTSQAMLHLRVRDNSGSADKIRVASMTWHD